MRQSIPLIGLCILLCLTCLAGPAGADEEAVIVAVFDMENKGSGLDAKVLVNLTDYLAVLLTEAGYQVIPRDQLRARLKQQKKESHKACHDQSCQVEMGRELAAQKSLSTQIFKIGKQCRLTATFYDLKRAATDKAVKVKSDCTEESLGEALEVLALKLTGKKVDAEKARRSKEKEAEERIKQKEAALVAAMAAKLKAENERKAKEKAEADQQVAEKAKAEQLAQAVKSSQEKEPKAKEDEYKSWAFKFRVGGLMPSFDDLGVDIDNSDDTDFGTAFGVYTGIEVDWRPQRYLVLGLYMDFAHQKEKVLGELKFYEIGLGLRFWGVLPIASSFELRLGIGVGVGGMAGPDTGGADLRNDPGLSVDAELGAAYALTDWFSLTADFGTKMLLFAKTREGEEFSIGPLLFFVLGTEFNF